MSSFTDTKERQQSVDFVDYFNAGILWAQRPGSPIDPPNNACGKKVAVQATTTEETDELPKKSKACTDAGKPAIEILKFDGQDAATNAVVLGQADAMSADSPVTAYAIKQSNGKLEAAGEIFDSAPYGWPVAKGSPLAASLQKALEHLISTGDYKTIASNWGGVEAGMVTKPVINGGGPANRYGCRRVGPTCHQRGPTSSSVAVGGGRPSSSSCSDSSCMARPPTPPPTAGPPTASTCSTTASCSACSTRCS